MNQLDGETSADVGVKGFMDEDVGLYHCIHQTVMRSIQIIPSFDLFPYGTDLQAIKLAFGGIDLTSLVFIDCPEGVQE